MELRLGDNKINAGIVVEKEIVPVPEPYTRPADWLPIPAFDSENKDEIYILNGVVRDGMNMLYFKLIGSGTIDWGDGSDLVTFNVSSETTYSHHFDYDDMPASSWTEHNKTRQVLVHIYGNRGAITRFNTSGITYKYTNADGVEVQYGTDISTDIYEINADMRSCYVLCSAMGGQKHHHIEIFDWKGIITTTNMQYMFNGCYSLQSIPQLDTSSVTIMFYMFNGCYSLQSIPQLDTSNVTNMSGMFTGCYSLQSIPQLDTSSVTEVSSMFSACYNLKTIPQLDTSNVTNMGSMFYSCYSLQSIPQLDTSSVRSTLQMFYNCYSLQSIPQLDTSSVSNIDQMFYKCYSLQNPIVYNAGAGATNAITLSISTSTMMTRQACLDSFNSLHPNDEGYSRTLTLGTTLGGRLSGKYVKDSGESVTAIVTTNDTAIIPGKTYYTYNEQTGEYTQVTPDFTTDTFYYELKTASWHRYDFCESTDPDAMLITDYFTDVLKWTVTGI